MMVMDDELWRSFKKNKYEERWDKEIFIDATGRNLRSLVSVLEGHKQAQLNLYQSCQEGLKDSQDCRLFLKMFISVCTCIQ